jgi:hypothetical protein
MADGHFWWAFAGGPVFEPDRGNFGGPARCRRTRSGWSKASLSGEPLNARSLSFALTRTASYQMTICSIKHVDYLLRRIPAATLTPFMRRRWPFESKCATLACG